MANTVGANQPFRYRGYVYDEETCWYYLQSRYYDPNTCRFISADVLLSTGQGVIGHNSFAYCLNEPINRIDDTGAFSLKNVLEFFENLVKGGGGRVGGNTWGSRNNYKAQEWLDGRVPNASQNKPGKHYDPNQQALIDLAQEFSRGVSSSDARILVSWAIEYGINYHDIMIHPNRSGKWSYTYHIKTHGYHIAVK